GTQVQNTSELFDPTTGLFTPGPLMQQARTGHVAVAFRAGQGEYVLLAGGASQQGTLATCELFDVALGQFVPLTAPMRTDRVDGRVNLFSVATALLEARRDHTATLLPTGRVLIVGGRAATGVIATSEEYDPAGNPPASPLAAAAPGQPLSGSVAAPMGPPAPA